MLSALDPIDAAGDQEDRKIVISMQIGVATSGRLVPASAAVPTAAADQQQNDDNDQKCLGIHIALLETRR
jgi:hypothetical protein